jgi:DNA-binding CsgD family transcriptional regulator
LVGGSLEVVETQVRESGPGAPGFGGAPVGVPSGSPAARVSAVVEVAFYRKYTEAMLRRYMRLSMEAGRVPSLMGRELFRGHVTSYKVKSFEDVVIFCYDVEKCLMVLDGRERELIKRIALQAYSQGEAAAILGISLRTCVTQYARTLDKLTRVLLKSELLRPLQDCQ